MSDHYSKFNQEHIEFIRAQKMFFVATAPSNNGKVNLSPKGYDTIRIISDNKVLYAGR